MWRARCGEGGVALTVLGVPTYRAPGHDSGLHHRGAELGGCWVTHRLSDSMGTPNPLCSLLRILSHTQQHVFQGRTEDQVQAEPSSPETDNGSVALRQEGGVANAGEGLGLGFGKSGLQHTAVPRVSLSPPECTCHWGSAGPLLPA